MILLLYQAVTKNQISNTKFQLKFFVVVAWLTFGVWYLVFSHWLMQLFLYLWDRNFITHLTIGELFFTPSNRKFQILVWIWLRNKKESSLKMSKVITLTLVDTGNMVDLFHNRIPAPQQVNDSLIFFLYMVPHGKVDISNWLCREEMCKSDLV